VGTEKGGDVFKGGKGTIATKRGNIAARPPGHAGGCAESRPEGQKTRIGHPRHQRRSRTGQKLKYPKRANA